MRRGPGSLVIRRFVVLLLILACSDLPTAPRTIVPATIAKLGGDLQTGVAGQALDSLLAVLVTDESGAPVSGITVTFEITGGNGGLSGSIQLTNASGVATLGGWTVGTEAGALNNTVRASVGALNTVFVASAAAGPLHHFAIEADSGGAIPQQIAGVPFAVRIVARDTFENTADGFNGTVDLTSNRVGSAGLVTTSPFASGVLASHSLSITQGGAGATITAKHTSGTEAGTSAEFVVGAGALHHFMVEASSGGAIGPQVAGVPFAIRVIALDSFANTVTAFSGAVAVASNRVGSAGLANTDPFIDGVLASHSITLSEVGAAAVISIARVGGSESGASAPFSVDPGIVHHFDIEPIPTATAAGRAGEVSAVADEHVAGRTFSVRITARDVASNVATSFNGTVVVSATREGTIGLTTTAPFASGVLPRHDIAITGAGPVSIAVVSTSGTQSGTSPEIVIAPAPLHHFVVEAAGGGPIGSQTAGAAFNIRISARDEFDNAVIGFVGTVDITANRAAATGVATTPAFSAGVLASHAIALTEPGAGAMITATRSGGAEAGTSDPFTVAAGPLHHFVVEAEGGGPIGGQVAGTPFGVRITAQDASGNVATAFNGTVDLRSNRSGSGLTTTAAFVAGVLSNHAVTITQSGAGAAISVTRTGGSETATSNGFVVEAGPLHHFTVEASGGGTIGTQVAGAPFSVRIVARDANENVANSFTGTATISSNRPGAAGLGTTALFSAGVLANHSVTLSQTGGGASITATRVGGSESGTSNAFSVETEGLHHFRVEAIGAGPIATQVAGAAFSIRITARDAADLVVAGFTGRVDVSSNRAGTSGLTTTAAFSAGVLESHAVTLTGAGAATITATLFGGGTPTGTSATFTVEPAALNHFAVEAAAAGSISTQTAGTSFAIRIIARDQFDNTASAFTGAGNTVVISSNLAGSSGLAISATFVNGVLANHAVTLTQAGATATITATRSGGTESGASVPFTVNAAPLDHFLVEAAGGGVIATQTAGLSFDIRITALDAFANTVTAFSGSGNTVDITANRAGSAGLVTSATFTSGILAIHAVTLTQAGAGSAITATHSAGTANGTSAAFVVNPSALHHFVVEAASGGPIPTQQANAAFSIRVIARDQLENTVTGFTGTVDVTSNRAGSSGLTTSAAFTDGVLAAHNITLTQAATNSIVTVTRTGGTETGASNAFTVEPGPLHHFKVEAAAGGTISTQLQSAPFSIRVTAQDATDNTVTAFSGGANTVSIASAGTLSLGAGTTAAFSAGVLASHSVAISSAGNFTIAATRTGGTETGQSNAFDVVPPVAITATVPTDGAIDIDPAANITIMFTRSVTATTSSFSIECPAASIPRPFAISGSPGTVITLDPIANLPAATVCQVTALAAEITDVFGFHPAANASFSFTTTLTANDDTYPETVIGNVNINSANVTTPFSVTANDVLDAATTITSYGATVGSANQLTANGGTIVLITSGADRGKFTYNPPVGFQGTDAFSYRVTAGAVTSDATVTFTVSAPVWFIDNNTGACTSSCDGRLTNPFTTLAALQAVNDGIGTHPRADNGIFIYQSATGYDGPVTLLDRQRLVGQDATVSLATLLGVTPPSGSAHFPVMNAADGIHSTITGAAGGVTLATGVDAFIHGLTIATTGGTALASGASFGTLTFANGTTETADVTIDATGGSAMSLMSGAVSGVVASASATGGANGLLFDQLTGSLTIQAGTLSGASADAVRIIRGSANLTYAGSVTATAADNAVFVGLRTAGTAELSGSIQCNAPCRGIRVQDNTGGVARFSGGSKVISTAAITAVSLTGNAGSSIEFTGGGLAITTTTATGFVAGSGTLVVSGSGNTITTTTGSGMNFTGSTIGAAGVGFANVTSGGHTGGSANLQFNSVVSTGGGSISIANGALSGATTAAILITAGSANITYAGTLTSTVTGVDVSNYAGTLTLSGSSKSIASGAASAVVLANNTGGTIAFANGGLVASTTTATTFSATGSGTVSVSGTGNTLASTAGVALRVENTTSGGLTFRSIAAAGAANGIFYSGAGSGGLTITGNGGRCDAGVMTCSGGTIGSTSAAIDGSTNGIGIYLNNSSNVELNLMRVNGTHQNFGIYASAMSGVTLDTLLVDGTFGTQSSEAAVAFDELSGSALVRGSTITPASGGFGDNLRVRNTTAITLNRITLDADTIGFTANNGGAGSTHGIYMLARAGTLNATIQDSRVLGGRANGILFTDSLTATSNLIVTGNDLRNGTGPYGTASGSALGIGMTGATNMTYNVANNTFTDLTGSLASLEFRTGLSTLAFSGTADGTLSSNVFGVAGNNTSGSILGVNELHLDVRGPGSQRAKVVDNQMYGYGADAFRASVGGNVAGANGKLDLTFARNTITDVQPAATFTVGVNLNAGILAGDAPTMCVDFGQGAGNQNDMDNSGSADVSVPFILMSTIVLNRSFVKFTNYPGGPDAGSNPVAPTKLNTLMRGGILNSTLDGIVVVSQANQVGSSAAVIGRTCNLPPP